VYFVGSRVDSKTGLFPRSVHCTVQLYTGPDFWVKGGVGFDMNAIKYLEIYVKVW